jgi:hypothetical protein
MMSTMIEELVDANVSAEISDLTERVHLAVAGHPVAVVGDSLYGGRWGGICVAGGGTFLHGSVSKAACPGDGAEG